MRLIAALLTLLLITAGCALASVKKKTTPAYLCVWPDPIEFNLADDNWTVCFDAEVHTHTGPASCTTVGQLRALVTSAKLAP